MNLIVVGACHRSAPVALLEQLSLLAGPQALAGGHLTEAVLLKTCNRVEVYAAVPAFHAGLTQIGDVLAAASGVRADELASSLYVHHGIDAVRHVFRVAAGLESMVAGEAQILGQLRGAYQEAIDADTVGKTLHELMQQALRVGKRAHAETGIDQAPRSLVAAALDQAALAFTPPVPASTFDALATTTSPALTSDPLATTASPALTSDPSATTASPALTSQDHRMFPEDAPILGEGEGERGAGAGERGAGERGEGASGGLVTRSARWVVVGAGAMGALARAELTRRGVTDIVVVNRSERAGSQPLSALPELMKSADVVITATASIAPVITRDMVHGPLTIIDLAMPRDVEAGVGALAGVRLIDIEHLTSVLPDHSAELGEVERIVSAEVDAFGSWLRGGQVAPTVAALRAHADDVVSNELKRLASRLPDLSQEQRDEVSHAIHRVVQRLLHQPTVRVRQLAAGPGGEAYTQLLRDLFDLNPQSSTVAEVPGVAQ